MGIISPNSRNKKKRLPQLESNEAHRLGLRELALDPKDNGGSNEGLRRVLMGGSAAGPSTAAAFLRSGLGVGSRVKAGRPVGRPLQLSKQERNKWF